MNNRLMPLLLGLGLLAGSSGAAMAQGLVPDSQVRAINTARNAAVAANGGLGVYNPANCMFQTTKLTNPCLISNDANGFVFRFLGGPAGWQAENLNPTLQTEIRISADGRSVVQMIYNGPPQ
jgi:hypothetical protein